MQYIPESKLRENETAVLDILDTISRKHLNHDVQGIITKFHNPYMTPDDSNIDKFWFNLGREVCNLNIWSWYCFDILQRRFGKSSKYCKYLNYKKDFDDLRNHLDKMLVMPQLVRLVVGFVQLLLARLVLHLVFVDDHGRLALVRQSLGESAGNTRIADESVSRGRY